MYRSAKPPVNSEASPVTGAVTAPSPPVTGAIAIPTGPKLRHHYDLEQLVMCQLMHHAVQLTLDVETRLGTKVGHKSMRAFSIETTVPTPAHRDDDVAAPRRGVRNVEVDLANAVWDTVYAMYAHDQYAVKLVVAIAAGAKWSRVARTDVKCRGEKMLGYVRLNALFRMWNASHKRLLPIMVKLQPNILMVVAEEIRRRKTKGGSR